MADGNSAAMKTITASIVLAGLLVSAQAHSKAAPRKPSSSAATSASTSELEAIWDMRAALNVAALQCQSDVMLALPDRYNTFLRMHEDELKRVHTSLVSKRGGQAKFDRINTQTYNRFATIKQKVLFCSKAADISIEAMNAAPNQLLTVARVAHPTLNQLVNDTVVASTAVTQK